MSASPLLLLNSATAPQALARIIAAVRLRRPLNCAMSAFAVLLGAWTVARQVPLVILLCGQACAALITAGGNTLNDYYDAEIDRLNHPRRSIPSSQISRRTAGYLAWAELAVGLAAGLSIGVGCGLIAFLAVALLIGYERSGLKNAGLSGNITISLLTALLFLMGGATAAGLTRPVSLAVLAFIASLGREIIKDIEDMVGDNTRRTWPMRVGPQRARITAALLLSLAVVSSPLPYLFGVLNVWYLPVVSVADVTFLATIIALFRLRRYASQTAKLAMLAVLAAILVGLLR